MQTQPLTLNIPGPLFQKLKENAERSRRSVEEETLDVLAASLPGDEVPADLAAALSSLDVMDDAALRAAAAGRLPPEASAELEALNAGQRRGGLSAAETARLSELVRQYERHMLVRAQAAVLLKRRGQSPGAPAAP